MALIMPISFVLLFTNIICMVRIANADDIIPKYPIKLIIAIPDLNPERVDSADSSIVSAFRLSFGNACKNWFLICLASVSYTHLTLPTSDLV